MTSDGIGFFELNSIRYVTDTKLKNEAGSVDCVAGDAGGTVVTFSQVFYDVTSISVTPMGTTPLTAVYDFVDVPSPTSFKVLLFNSSGARVSGKVSWAVKGY